MSDYFNNSVTKIANNPDKKSYYLQQIEESVLILAAQNDQLSEKILKLEKKVRSNFIVDLVVVGLAILAVIAIQFSR